MADYSKDALAAGASALGTSKCPLCDSVITDDNPALKLAALEKYVSGRTTWNMLANRPVGYTFQVERFSCNVEVTKTDPGYPANGYDGAYEQGSEFEAFVVIAVDGTYFKKTGTGDSYGDVTWDGPVKIVQATEKIVKVFE